MCGTKWTSRLAMTTIEVLTGIALVTSLFFAWGFAYLDQMERVFREEEQQKRRGA